MGSGGSFQCFFKTVVYTIQHFGTLTPILTEEYFFKKKKEWLKQLLLSSIFVVFILSGSLFVKENNLTAMFVNPLAFLCSGGIFIVEYLLAILNCSSI